MSTKRMILTLVLIAIAVAVFLAYKTYTRTNKDLLKLKADIQISAGDLIKEFEAGDSAANKKYLDKIIELTGNVKKLEKDDAGDYTIIIGDTLSMSSVRCLSDTNHRSDAAIVKENSTITIRGVCTGFKKNELLGENLGSDVELTRSVIIKK
jgi:predicted phosphodiesterase